jgi:hypothetical protein
LADEGDIPIQGMGAGTMGDCKETKGASDREVRAHVRRVLKQLMPKRGEKKKGAGDRRERLHMVARAVGTGSGGLADAGK